MNRSPSLPAWPSQDTSDRALITRAAPPDWPWFPGVDGELTEFRCMVEHGLLRPFTDQTFIASDCSGSRDARAAALAVAVPGRSVVALLTAAWLWGWRDSWSGYPYLYVRGRRDHRRFPSPQALRRAQGRVPDPVDVVSVGEIEVTTPAATAVDCAMRSHIVVMRQAAEFLLRHVVHSDRDVNECLASRRMRPGITLARHVVASTRTRRE